MRRLRYMYLIGVMSAATLISGCHKKEIPSDIVSTPAVSEESTFDQMNSSDGNETQESNIRTPQVNEFEPLNLPDPGEVKLPSYDKLTVIMNTPEPTEVSDEDLGYYIQLVLMNHMEAVTGRGAEAGDLVTIDFEGTIHGEPYNGSDAENIQFMLGNGEVLPEFESAVEGKFPGETIRTTVNYPVDYPDTTIQGKAAEVIIEIKAIERIPELTKEFVLAHTKTGAESIGDYYNELEAEYLEILKRQYKLEAVQKGVTELSEQAEFESSEGLSSYMLNYYQNDFNSWLASSGISVDDYKEMTGMSDEDIKKDIQNTAETNTARLVTLQQIMEQENLTVTDEMMLDYHQTYYGENHTIEELKQIYGTQYDQIKMQVAVFTYMMDRIEIVYEEPISNAAKEVQIESETQATEIAVDTEISDTEAVLENEEEDGQ